MHFQIISIIKLLGIIHLAFGNPILQTKSSLCETPECVRTASSIKNEINENVESCENFYQFACGNFLREATIPIDKYEITQYSIVFDKIQRQLNVMLSAEGSENDPKHFLWPKNYYKSCMNTTLIEKLGGKLMQEIGDSVGGWPVVRGRNWNMNDSWSWEDTLIQLNGLGFPSESSLFQVSINIDAYNNTKHVVEINELHLDLPRKYLIKGLNDTRVMAYYNYMVAIAVEFGANEQFARDELNKSLQFEIEIANMTLSSEEDSNLVIEMTIEEIQKKYPYLDWLNYLNTFFPEHVNLDKGKGLLVVSSSFFEKLGNLLEKTSKRTLANYIMWKAYEYAVPYLSENFLKHKWTYLKIRSGKKEKQLRWKKCVDETADSLSLSVTSFYIQKHFDLASEQKISEMVEIIRKEFTKILSKTEWMDDVTKEEAVEKLNKMQANILFPNEYFDNNKLWKYYAELDNNEDYFFHKRLILNIFHQNKKFGQIHLPFNRSNWLDYNYSPTKVNSFYDFQRNALELPVAILQDIYFDTNRPKYMNYGAIGIHIGHEMMHGFDQIGIAYDSNGNIRNWMATDAQVAYRSQQECITYQYGNYTDPVTGLKLNGMNTLDENLADNFGIKIAYLAYKQWAESNGPELKLPGLDYTPEQLFWISAAQVDCTKTKKVYLKHVINRHVHSPEEFRVLGVLKNMENFSKDFNCPIGSPMNPEEKCEIW